MSEPTFIATIAKNSLEDVRVALDEYQGTDLIDVRVWADFKTGPAGLIRAPTKKGVALNVRALPELIRALQGAEEEARRRGLLPDAP